MAETRRKDNELPRCSTLFLTEDGSPMLFNMTPSVMKTRLRPLIHHGGGELSSKVLPDSIMLADPSSGVNLSGYISTDYIFDSIKHNRLQDLKKYRLKPSGGSSTNKSSENHTNLSPSTSKILGSRKRGGRQAYTVEEDMALILFVQENKDFHSVKGNSMYKEAAKAKVTSHTWQSMRDHYLKVLRKSGKKPSDYEKQILKADSKKLQIVVKGKSTDSHVVDSVTDNSSASDVESVDYDKMFDDSLLQLASESIIEKDHNEVNSFERVNHNKNEETKDSSIQEPETRVITRQLKVQMDKQENLSDFDGEVSFREDSKRHSTDDEEDKRPIAKRSRKDGKEANDCHETRRSKRRGKVANVAVDESPALIKRSKRDGLEVNDGHKSPVTKQSRRDGKGGYDVADKRSAMKLRGKRDLAPLSQGREASNTMDRSSPKAERSKEDLAPLLNGIEDDEVKKSFLHLQALQTSIQKLESQRTVPQIIHALFINSGMLDDAENYLQQGTAGKELWSSEEDKVLLSKDKEAISNLAKTRGLHSVLNRINFIEGIN